MSSPSENQDQAASPQTPGRRKRRWRRFLLTLGPLAVLAGAAFFYWTGGRYVDTDNAYVQADKVAVTAEVSGPIVEVMVRENQSVEKGEPLFRIDDRSYVIALEQARARLREALTGIKIKKASYQQKQNEMKLAQSDIDYARKNYRRQASLDSSQAVAKAQLDDSEHTLEVSQHKLDIIRNEAEQILASLEGDPDIPAEQLAGYRLARAAVENAALEVERTVVRAPFSGRVSKVPQVGKHVEPGTPVMSLIDDNNFWIEANLKETELTHVLPGQKAAIDVDTYPDHVLTGRVLSISPGTGSEFSILPAQNSTGNWVKIVQRVSVRIAVDRPAPGVVLRAGMSSTVSIDTEYHRRLPSVVRDALALVGLGPTASVAENRHP